MVLHARHLCPGSTEMKAMKAKTIFTAIIVLACLSVATYAQDYQAQQKIKDRERAAYWAQRGYTFDHRYMTAYSMDQKVKDIVRAKYWKEKGYSFNADYMTAYSMDQKVKWEIWGRPSISK